MPAAMVVANVNVAIRSKPRGPAGIAFDARLAGSGRAQKGQSFSEERTWRLHAGQGTSGPMEADVQDACPP
jgi:hypothetical protein